MDFSFDYGFPGLASMLQGVMIFAIVFSCLIALAMWIMQSIGFMRMAKKVGFADPWLAWIPGAGDYLFVKLAGEKRRKIGIAYMFLVYLALPVVIALFWVGLMSFFTSFITLIMGQAFNGYDGNWYDPSFINGFPMGMNVGALVLFILGGLALMAIGIVAAVFYYIMLYHVFKRFKPNVAVVFLVLSIIFSFLAPIFILVASFGTPDENVGEGAMPPAIPAQQPPSFTPPAGNE